jgi:hypothetical protein
MASSGGLSCPDSDARMTYYNMSGIPDVVFDGLVHEVGAGSGHVDGTIYASIIDNRLQVTSPLEVRILDYDYAMGAAFVTVEVEIYEDMPSIDETYIRVGVCEDGLVYSGTTYHNTLRDMLTDTPLTVDEVGEVQQITLPMTVDPSWDPEELWVWAIVQRDSDKAVHNAVCSKTPRDFAVSVGVEGVRQAILEGPYTFGNTTVTNVGLQTDTFDLGVDVSSLPEGWSSHFTIDGVDYTETSVSLAPQESVLLNVTLVPNENPGSGTAYLTLHPQSGAYPDRAVGFAGLTSGTDLLVVADDGGAGYAYDYYAPAISTTGKSFAVWDRGFSPLSAADMSAYEAVIWFSTLEDANIYESDRAEIEAYLQGGGNLFLTGQNVAESIKDSGGIMWIINVLKSTYQFWLTGGDAASGVPGDEISDGLELDLVGGDGAGNLHAPDVLAPNGEFSTKIFDYAGTANGCGNRVEYDGCKIVFLGFGFESINSTADRNLLMQRVLGWLVGGVGVDDDQLPQPIALHQNVPNPFNPQTKISFRLADESPVRLEIFDLTGRRVRVLADGIRAAGEHSVIWDGRDGAGSPVSSGSYFYRLTSDDEVISRKMTMLK